MKCPRLFSILLVAGLAVAPAMAAIKAMNLTELMQITDDTVLVRITASYIQALAWPVEEAVWTRLTVEGQSLRTGEPVAKELLFLGSHDPNDNYGTSEMPTLQDTRVGNEVLVFHGLEAGLPGGGAQVVHSLASIFRVERGFGEPTLMGKGEGTAFPENVKLSQAVQAVQQAHQALQATGNGR